MEAQRDECGARILLGDKTGGGAGGFIVLEFGFQLDSLVYMCMYIYIYIYIYIYLKLLNTQLQFTQNFDLCRIFREITAA